MARILSHNTTSDTFRNCRQMPMTEEQDQLSLHGGRRGGKSKENRGAKTWLTKIFISREEISVEDRLVKKTTIKINSKVLMLCQQSDKIFQVSQSVTKHWPCNISYLHVWGECTDKKKPWIQELLEHCFQENVFELSTVVSTSNRKPNTSLIEPKSAMFHMFAK